MSDEGLTCWQEKPEGLLPHPMQALVTSHQRLCCVQAAIFGKSSSAGLPGSQGQQDDAPSLHVGLGLGASFANGAGGRELDSYPEPVGSKPVPAVSMVVADVLSAQPGISWRERAALKKKQLFGQDQ